MYYRKFIDFLKRHNLYDEKIATTKAIELIKKHYKTVLMFEYLLAELLKENAGVLAQR